jgi:hypothetical protein
MGRGGKDPLHARPLATFHRAIHCPEKGMMLIWTKKRQCLDLSGFELTVITRTLFNKNMKWSIRKKIKIGY